MSSPGTLVPVSRSGRMIRRVTSSAQLCPVTRSMSRPDAI
jgi:hypothetical protein